MGIPLYRAAPLGVDERTRACAPVLPPHLTFLYTSAARLRARSRQRAAQLCATTRDRPAPPLRRRHPVQENRILTPFLFTLLLLIVFFVWVNVMVAIISEVYQQECDDALNISWDEDFPRMSASVPQPQNDLDAMRLHYPVQSLSNEAAPQPVALEPERCPPPSTASDTACFDVLCNPRFQCTCSHKFAAGQWCGYMRVETYTAPPARGHRGVWSACAHGCTQRSRGP